MRSEDDDVIFSSHRPSNGIVVTHDKDFGGCLRSRLPLPCGICYFDSRAS